jgi:hypothetical protein
MKKEVEEMTENITFEDTYENLLLLADE